MEIEVLACESLGVRSMAVEVKVGGLTVLIDPSAALAARRYGLPPDELELNRLKELRELIRTRLLSSDLVVITHYHFDHYNPDWIEELKGKQLYLKNPTENINASQRARAKKFLKALEASGISWQEAEGKKIEFSGGIIEISSPFWHGPDTKLGWIVSVFVEDGEESFLHTSDVSGPVQKEAVEYILRKRPDVVFLDGPSTYLGPRYGIEALEEARFNLLKIVEEARPSKLVLDHHLVRDLGWRKWAEPVFEKAASVGCEVLTGASFSGKEELFLEAERRSRYLAKTKS